MSSKLSQLRFKQVGQNLNVVINDNVKSIVITDKEEREAFKDKLKKYTEKPTVALLKEIEAKLNPKTTADKQNKEKEVETIKAKIKAEKNKAKASEKSSNAKKTVVKEIASSVGKKASKVSKALPASKEVKALPEKQKALSASKTKDTLVDDLSRKLEAGTVSQAEIDKLQSLLNKAKKIETPKASVGSTRRGEY